MTATAVTVRVDYMNKEENAQESCVAVCSVNLLSENIIGSNKNNIRVSQLSDGFTRRAYYSHWHYMVKFSNAGYNGDNMYIKRRRTINRIFNNRI